METNTLVYQRNPEEREYDKKCTELSNLEAAMAERELELATLRAELDAFSNRYQQAVGGLIAEFDAIIAEITDTMARQHPDDATVRSEADTSRQRANESAAAMGWVREHVHEQSTSFRPAEELKLLYREVAKTLHPDLATDEEEQRRRQHVMADANDAYKHGEVDRLRTILREWKESPEAVRGNDTAADLVRVIRKIAQVEARLEQIDADIADLKTSDLYQLWRKVEIAAEQGRDLLTEMVDYLQNCIREERSKMNLFPGLEF